MADDPIADVYVDGVAPAKADARSYANSRARVRFANAAEVNAKDLTGILGIEIAGKRYELDTSDTTTADDGALTLVDLVGQRFKLVAMDKATRVEKTASQTKTATTTLANDSELLFAMLANRKYSVRGKLLFTTTAAGDFKARHTGPAAPTLVAIERKSIAPGASAEANVAVDAAYSASDIAVTGGAGPGSLTFEGVIHNGANAGNFAIQWAQNTSDPGNTVVLAGSYLDYRLLPA